ncbi:MAG: thioredoxin domain-containing protein [Dehalococcoidales bacterium]|nr:thioredoxin domain-containing protein [Dehalococcoidales bacterium]
MRALLQNRWLMLALRLALGVVFLVASIAKIQDVAQFVSTVASYGILSENLAIIYGDVVPWVELFIGCSLILGAFVRFSVVLLIPLIISFMVASSYALVNDIGGSCGCFGEFLTLSHPVALTIDVLMLLSSFLLLFLKGKEFISIGQLVARAHIKSRILSVGFRFAVVVLVVITIGFIVVGVCNPSNRTGVVIETVNVPAPIANVVDNALIEKKPVLIEFYSEGCGACKEAEPTINDLEREYVNKIVFLRLDYYQNPPAVSDMAIVTTPAILVIVSKNTEGTYGILCRFGGTIEREALQACLDKSLLEVKD